ncbi:SP family sugar:H+ symporter-like MFS transporter [Novosphingobium sp. PhB165]|uniref:sugar porter family MFS transporter n=1 Tax=Novosphingobium sp. PhB165 TaxID=2485105 RepID=UPI001052B8C6|nr:sugar porter family MFS transporter [Novosphingobium sp. PhB165]TCM21709.1 SP family sugar:H+ symporter-like MFS transporter [Novosphingobium sp. PhB165]
MTGKSTGPGANLGFIGLIVAVATIGGFMFGYDSGAINGTQDGLRHAFGLTEGQLGLTVSALLPGCALGAFLAGRFADVFGRRTVMMMAALLFLISALVSGAAPSAIILAIARFFAGAAVGAASVLSPAYISEVTPAAIRGRLSSAQQVMIISGLTGAFLANYWLAGAAGSSLGIFWGGYPAWRWMFWVQALPALLFFVTLLLIPESPRFLVSKGRNAEALTVLGKLFGTDAARVKLGEIEASLTSDHAPSLADIRKPGGGWRPIVWVGIGLAVFQQLVGINVVFYYGAVLWQAVGFSEADALKINILSGALSILACLLSIALVDRIGRKPLLLWGSIGMTVTLATLVWCFAQASIVDGKLALPGGVGTIALVAANVYVVFFNMSWGPVMWVMLGEMFPNQMRGSALAVAGAAQWLANFAVSSSFPWLAANIGLPVTYGFYTLGAALSVIFVLRAVHETKGIELEAMKG